MSERRVYLDNAAATAADPRAVEAMLPYFSEQYANPAGSSSFSARVRSAVEKAREQVAGLIGAQAGEIIFTSGGTESDNMALLGTAAHFEGLGKKRVITGAIEHPAVLNACSELKKRGFGVMYAPCDNYGYTDTDFVREYVGNTTSIVSVMTVNNELGSIQKIDEFADAAHSAGAYFHTDAVQAAGHIPVDVRKTGTDLLSISSHKLHGPKGIGALFVRKGVHIDPIVFGGGQEGGMRSGTLNVPGIIGFGKACEIAKAEMERTGSAMMRQKKYFTGLLTKDTEGVFINSPEEASPAILSVSFDGIEGSSLLIELDMKGICCSTGSACSASSEKPSHVLTAAGLSASRIKGSIRFSFSRFTTDEELEYAARAVSDSVRRLRDICGYQIR